MLDNHRFIIIAVSIIVVRLPLEMSWFSFVLQSEIKVLSILPKAINNLILLIFVSITLSNVITS